jgi:hypothetical protein
VSDGAKDQAVGGATRFPGRHYRMRGNSTEQSSGGPAPEGMVRELLD